MIHSEVLKKFKELLNIGDIDVYFPNGFNSIRIRLMTGSEIVFTYENDHKWCIETVTYHISKMTKH
jgi:hypothetical protein